MLRSAEMLLMLVDVSENVDRLEKCIEESEIVPDVRSCSWETEFIIVDWLSVSTAVEASIESVTEKVLTGHILVEDTEGY